VASSNSSSSKIRFIPPESSRNFLCNSRISPNAKKLCETTEARKRRACASSPENNQNNNNYGTHPPNRKKHLMLPGLSTLSNLVWRSMPGLLYALKHIINSIPM